MLFQAPDAAAPVRIQSAFVSDREITRLAAYWRGFSVSKESPERPDLSAAFERKQDIIVKQTPLWEEVEEDEDLDDRYHEAVQIVKEENQASISMLQRKMRIGYTRAARIIDKMQEKGLISEPDPQSQIRYFLGDS
jgi:S-DNA-T family DNA segregation ATPase FtsK/SpoIIIE